MKKTISILFIALLGFAIQAKAQTVSFLYDDDGNMKQRIILTVPPPQGAKKAIIEQPQPITDVIGEQKVTIYPVPTKGLFQIDVTLLDSKVKNYFTLYSITGKLLLEKNITNEATDIDISLKPAGTYLLDIFLGKKVSRWKVIKQ